MQRISIAVIADKLKIYESLIQSLRLRSNLEVAFEGKDGDEFLLALEKGAKVDIVLIDVQQTLPEHFKPVRLISYRVPFVKIIAVNNYMNEGGVLELSKLGVRSILATENLNELPRVIQIVNATRLRMLFDHS